MKKRISLIMAILMIIQIVVLCMPASAIDPAIIAVSSGEGCEGDTVVLAVSIANNTGFGGLDINVKFDKNVLEFVGAECLIDGFPECSPIDVANTKGFVSLAYVNFDNVMVNDTIFTVTFKIKEGATVGDSAVSLVCNSASFYYDGEMQDFTATVTSGKVTVKEKSAVIRGDVNLDGKVDSDDLTMLARHVGGIEEFTNAMSLVNGDTNKDGRVDSDDLTQLARHVGGIEEFPEIG